MSLVGPRLSCLKSSGPRFSRVPSHLPRTVSNFSRHILLYSRSSARNLPCGTVTPFLTTSRTFSIWPFSKSSSPEPSSPPEPIELPEISAASLPKETLLESTASAEPVTKLSDSLPEGLDLSPPVDLLPADLVDAAVNSSILPLQYGDLASLGLISYTPAGLVRWSMELINVSSGMSWFWTIVAGTLLWRLLLLPVAIKTYRFSSRVQLIQPEVKSIMDRMLVAKSEKNLLEMSKLQQDQLKLYKSVGISPLGGLVGPVFQIPVALGMFIGLKKMCELPVAQLTTSGLDFLPDLTVADPTGLLAPAFAVTLFWQMTVTARDMDIEKQQGMAHVMNMLRFPGAPLIALFMTQLPSGLVVSVIVAGIATGLQSLLFRIAVVRRYFDILPLPDVAGRKGLPSFKDTAIWVRNWWREQWDYARSQADASKNRGGPPRRRL